MSPHLPRLGLALRALLRARRTATLATRDAAGAPFVSMVPFAIDGAARRIVLHVSGLAAHTGHMAADPRVALLVAAAEQDGAPVHELPRVSLAALAATPGRGSAGWASARAAYLARFPEAEPMTALGDFRFVALELTGARQVAGFGTARSVGADELALLLAPD